MNDMHWTDLLFNVSISLFGGIVKSLTSKTKKKLSHFITSAIVGGFAGLLTYMLCSSCGASWQITSFATGVAGYMGETILDLFTRLLPELIKKFVTGKFNIQIVSNVESDSKESSKSKNKKEKKDK